ncbi:MAG: hypothetical protein IKM88_13160, partial [Lachnospiraceae bacterium]|nr:hypothetical protein [Lachnospiraceae bacterium]
MREPPRRSKGGYAELFKHFGSLDKIKAATVDELSTVPSMTRAAAQALKEFF